MTKSLSGELKRALLNNSYDHDIMKERLTKEWQSSYSYLEGYQDDIVGYDIFSFEFNDETARQPSKIGKFWLDQKRKVCFSLGYEMINTVDREEYRKSKFYMNFFSFDDLLNNYTIFKKMPIFIIDDKVIWDYEMKIDLDSLIIRLPYDKYFIIDTERNPVTDDIVYLNHNIHIMFVDNIHMVSFTNNRTMLNFNRAKNSFTISKKAFPHQTTCKYGMYMCNFELETGKYHALGSTLYELEEVDDNFYQITMSQEDSDKIASYTGNIKMNIVWMNNLHKKTFYTSKDYLQLDGFELPFFVIEKDNLIPYEMPILSKNLLILKETGLESAKGFRINRANVNRFYPNIYQIYDGMVSNDDRYKVFYFYKPTSDTKYTVLHEFYYKFLCNKFGLEIEQCINDLYFDRINHDTMSDYEYKEFRAVFDKILNYQEHRYTYGEIDFLYNFLPASGDPELNAFEYHVGKMREWIANDPFMLERYVLDQNLTCKGRFHLWVSTIDLESRLRTDTSVEFDDGRSIYTFKEPMYVFAFRNDLDYPNKVECRLFIDGMMVTDSYQERKMTLDYIYIPASQVKEDSFIEIEVFDSYGFDTVLYFTAIGQESSVIVLEPDENIVPTIADLIVMDEEYGTSYTLGVDYQIKCIYTEGEAIAEEVDENSPVEFTRLSKFIVTALHSDILYRNIILRIAKKACGVDYELARSCYPYIVCETRDFNMKKEYLRLYRNGRLIPDCRWKFYKSGNIPRVSLEDFFSKGDHLYLDITPYRYKSVYYKEEIQLDHPVIDLTGYINKPFDIRYYDVYLNGRKLTVNNIVALSPFSITLFNIKSKYQLEIFEKERDYEYFGVDYMNQTYFFTPNNLLYRSFMKNKDINMLIDDIIEHKKDEHVIIKGNTDEEAPLDRSIVSDFVHALLYYDKELLPQQWLNPDRKQFNKEHVQEEYNLIAENFIIEPRSEGRDKLEENRKRFYPPVLNLNPDIRLTEKDDSDSLVVYMLGHPKHDEEELENVQTGLETFDMKYKPNLN